MDNDSSSTTANTRWGAHKSLRKNAGLDGRRDDEESPLLRTDSPTTAPVWEGYADFEDLPWWRRPSLFWLLPAFSLFALAWGGLIVPKLNLTLTLICREYLSSRALADPSFTFAPVLLDADNPQCRVPEVQSLVTQFSLYLSVVAGVLSAIMSPKLGALSDRYGRNKFMVVSSLGLFLTELVTILASKYPDTVNYRWFMLGAVFDGMCGSFTAGMALNHAYAADITPPPKRAVAFGYFHACLFGGIAGGPLVAALLIKLTGELLIIFYVGIGVHVFFMFYILFVVPESLSQKRQILAQEKHADARMADTSVGWTRALKKTNILEPLKILWPTGPGTSNRLRANLILLSIVDTTAFGVAMGSMTVLVYYLGYQFSWSTADTSVYVSLVSITRVASLIAVLPLLNYVFRTRLANKQRRESGFAIPERNSGSDLLDLNIIRGALLIEVLGYTIFALARAGGVFVVGGMIASSGGIASPTLQSALTKHVPHDKVGQLLGATGLLHALARIVTPIVFNSIYSSTVKTWPQAFFVVIAACFGVAFLVSWLVWPHVYLEDLDQTTANPVTSASERNTEAETLLDEEIVVA